MAGRALLSLPYNETMKHSTLPQRSRRLLLQAAAAMLVLALARPALFQPPEIIRGRNP